MILAVALGREGLIAVVALKGALPRVGAQVHIQVGPLREDLFAALVRAGESGLLFLVREHVLS